MAPPFFLPILYSNIVRLRGLHVARIKPFSLTNSRWAWQHIHDSRHAKPEKKTNDPKADEQPKRAKRRSNVRSLSDALTRLHLLLRSKYFCDWPLEVRFFCPDVYRAWKTCSDKRDGLVPDSIKILGLPKDDINGGETAPRPRTRNFHGIDVSNRWLKKYREKVVSVLDEKPTACGVCKQALRLTDNLIVVCSHENCHCTFHLLCLASKFLEQPDLQDKLLPTGGQCPGCKEKVEWSTLMREVSLRIRGKALKRGRKGKAVESRDTPSLDDDTSGNSDTESDMSGEDHEPRNTAPNYTFDEWQDHPAPRYQEPYDEICWLSKPASRPAASGFSAGDRETLTARNGDLDVKESWKSGVIVN